MYLFATSPTLSIVRQTNVPLNIIVIVGEVSFEYVKLVFAPKDGLGVIVDMDCPSCDEGCTWNVCVPIDEPYVLALPTKVIIGGNWNWIAKNVSDSVSFDNKVSSISLTELIDVDELMTKGLSFKVGAYEKLIVEVLTEYEKFPLQVVENAVFFWVWTSIIIIFISVVEGYWLIV